MVITMKQIPLLGVLCLNRGDLLLRMVKSIDFPVAKLQLIVNYIKEVDESIIEAALEIEQLIQDKKIPVETANGIISGQDPEDRGLTNIGVSGGWNKIIRLNPDVPYWIIVGNDIQFTPGDLEKVYTYAEEHKDHATMFANHGHSFFVLTQEGLRAGTFDENIYPAYLEDCDHSYRIKMLGLTVSDIPDIHAIHGEAPTWGSSTIYSNTNYLKQNGITHGNNFRYYRMKWGGNNGEEKYTHPFDDPEWPVNKWEPLSFFREKNSIWGT